MGSSTFIALSDEKEDWRIDLNLFVDELRKQWPYTKIVFDNSPSGPKLLHWTITNANPQDLCWCSLFDDYSSISIEKGCSWKVRASIAVWYRKLVPAYLSIVMYIVSSKKFLITPELTSEDLYSLIVKESLLEEEW